ncbi:cold shock protein (beta-ribbon, CspA family) [Prauserella flava]|nr:cold shock protein (beta-ribbon, CspA family) [Prauserella flava]MCR3735213.1 cold shock protein (beta-ribbon, CspA family) [Prauserella salsuginis]
MWRDKLDGTRVLGTQTWGAFVMRDGHISPHRGQSSEGTVREVPTGKVKWYDADKGFGFVTQDGGEDVFIRKAALPQGVESLKSGQRLEFGVADGRRGPQALSIRLLDAPPSVAEARRRPAEELHGMVDDMIKLLEATVQPELRRGRYPERKKTKKIAEVMRAVARDLDP